jgi:hypothetical protein
MKKISIAIGSVSLGLLMACGGSHSTSSGNGTQLAEGDTAALQAAYSATMDPVNQALSVALSPTTSGITDTSTQTFSGTRDCAQGGSITYSGTRIWTFTPGTKGDAGTTDSDAGTPPDGGSNDTTFMGSVDLSVTYNNCNENGKTTFNGGPLTLHFELDTDRSGVSFSEKITLEGNGSVTLSGAVNDTITLKNLTFSSDLTSIKHQGGQVTVTASGEIDTSTKSYVYDSTKTHTFTAGDVMGQP